MQMLRTVLLIVALGFTMATMSKAQTGFLLLAPDRGFLGNEESRDAFEVLRSEVDASVLAFATSEKTSENLQHALDELNQRAPSLSEVVVLPMFLTEHHALYQTARAALESMDVPGIRFASPLGESYLAEEILFDRIRRLLPDDFKGGAAGHAGHGAHGAMPESHVTAAEGTSDSMQHGVPRLVLVASGAGSESDADAIKGELDVMARRASEKFGLAPSSIAVLYDWSAPDSLVRAGFESATEITRAAAMHGDAVVVPFNLAARLTTMMADWSRLERALDDIPNAHFDGEGVLPHPNVERWLIRTANAQRPLARDEIGVILVPHGSDHNWNQAMRNAMAPISERYVTEEAFSMVDPFVVERAVRRLEARGMKAAVLVRIFSLESSFRDQAEYILGLRPDYRGPHADRISSHLLFATAGGMEAHHLLAEAMLDRALEVSQDPERETVVLVAHGTGGDDQNEHWMRNLESIARHIEEHEPGFRSVKFHTWREDWPEKREASIQAIRTMVSDASADGGTALVIPVRTIDQGPEADFLDGLAFRHGRGFAPHPKFVQWLEEVIAEGIGDLHKAGASEDVATRGASHDH